MKKEIKESNTYTKLNFHTVTQINDVCHILSFKYIYFMCPVTIYIRVPSVSCFNSFHGAICNIVTNDQNLKKTEIRLTLPTAINNY